MPVYFLFTASWSGHSDNNWVMDLPNTGCTRLGAISASGVSTNRLFCICGWGILRSGRSTISSLKKIISISIMRGPYFSPLNLPIFCSTASRDRRRSTADNEVSSRSAWLRKSGWSVFPQAAVSNTDDDRMMDPQEPEISSLVLSRFSNLAPMLPPISKYARFIERNIRGWPNITILPLKPLIREEFP